MVMASGSTAGSGELYTHGGVFIHHIYWEDIKVNQVSENKPGDTGLFSLDSSPNPVPSPENECFV